MKYPDEIMHNGKTLTEILRLHKNWRANYPDGVHANLNHAYLSHANLSNTNLSYADLSNADLSHADLSHADLRNANLSNANLSNADLNNASLSNADLSYVDLRNADLSHADFSDADLSYANLSNSKRHSQNISKFAYAHGLYEYSVFAFIFEDGSKIIEMGCKHQSPEEWETNFWNNPSQFPDDGSAKTKRRILALKWANDVIKIMEDDK